MKFGALGPGAVRLEERPEPTAGPGEVLVSLAACGICGTDLEKVRGNYRTAGILGHEPVGTVRAVGAGVSALRVGTRVFAHHHVPCGHCEVCARGAPTFCPEYSRTNLDPGGFSETFRLSATHVRAGAVLPLSENVSWEVGTLLEPAGCALTALRAVGLAPGHRVAILGFGPVGLLYARVARALGAGWIGGTDPSELRRNAAVRGGAEAAHDPRDASGLVEAVREVSHGGGVDLAVVATGAPAAIRLAFDLVRRGGTVNLFGLPESGHRLEEELQKLYLRGVRVIPTYATTEADIAEIHRLVGTGVLTLSDLVTHRFPLDRIPEAFAMAGRANEAIKVVVTGPSYGG